MAGAVRGLGPVRGQVAVRAARIPLVARESGGAADAVDPLWDSIQSVYERAQRSGAALRTQTHAELVQDQASGIHFVLQVAENLERKHNAGVRRESTTPGSGAKAFNPFLPYDEALWVQHLSPTHTLLLNKFNIAPLHSLVVTRAFEAQDTQLTAADFEATLRVLQAAPAPGALMFFNSGGPAGASQPHRHLQIVPLPLADVGPKHPPLAPLAERQLCDAPPGSVHELRDLPYASWAARLASGASGAEVHKTYLALAAAAGVYADAEDNSSKHARRHYNLLLWPGYLQLVPRRAERSGGVACNALCFAGTFFVKSNEQRDEVLAKGPWPILEEVGWPWTEE